MNIETLEVSMPTPRAISASSTVARTTAPMRVRSMANQSASPIAAASAIMKMRYTGRCNAPTTTLRESAAGGWMIRLSPPQMSSAACWKRNAKPTVSSTWRSGSKPSGRRNMRSIRSRRARWRQRRRRKREHPGAGAPITVSAT